MLQKFFSSLKSDFSKPFEILFGASMGTFACVIAVLFFGDVNGADIPKILLIISFFLIAPLIVALSFSSGTFVAMVGAGILASVLVVSIKQFSGKWLRLAIFTLMLAQLAFGMWLSSRFIAI